jgi:hypothetical protein
VQLKQMDWVLEFAVKHEDKSLNYMMHCRFIIGPTRGCVPCLANENAARDTFVRSLSEQEAEARGT